MISEDKLRKVRFSKLVIGGHDAPGNGSVGGCRNKKPLAEIMTKSYWLVIARMKITEILMAEHAVFHNLFDHLEKHAPRAKTLAEIKVLAAALETLLRAHSDTEDELFIAPLEH